MENLVAVKRDFNGVVNGFAFLLEPSTPLGIAMLTVEDTTNILFGFEVLQRSG